MAKLLTYCAVVGCLVGLVQTVDADELFEGKSAAAWIKQLSDSNAKVDARIEAARAVALINKSAPGTMDALKAALKDSDEDVRYWACYGISQYGSGIKDALTELRSRLNEDRSIKVRWQAANALGCAGAAAKPAVPDLIKALKDSEPWLRWNAATALGGIGPDAKEAVPELEKAIYDFEYIVRRGSVLALGEIGPSAKSAIPALLRTWKDDDQFTNVRKLAADAVKKIDPAEAEKAGIK